MHPYLAKGDVVSLRELSALIECLSKFRAKAYEGCVLDPRGLWTIRHTAAKGDFPLGLPHLANETLEKA